MTRAILFLLVLTGSSTTSLWAQLPNGCVVQGIYWAGDPLPSPGVQWGQAPGFPGGWFQTYWFNSYSCPDAPPCPTCCPTTSCGSPINLASGDTYIPQDDFSVPGLGGGLALSRTWHSYSSGASGMFGLGWRSTYEESISVTSEGYIAYSRGNGDNWTFGFYSSPTAPTTYLPMTPSNTGDSLVWDGTNWTVTFKSGEKRVLSGSTGSLISIIDRNGNTTQLTYNAFNQLVTVTDPASRTLTFSYTNGLVTGITSSVGISLSYAYDNYGHLIQITKPDQTTVSFQYDNFSHITAVLDSQGKLLESHTYDLLGRGTSSSRALGADALTVSY
jgi:YD repeat-containing protein